MVVIKAQNCLVIILITSNLNLILGYSNITFRCCLNQIVKLQLINSLKETIYLN